MTAVAAPARRALHLLAAVLALVLAAYNLLGPLLRDVPWAARDVWIGAAAVCMAGYFLLQNRRHCRDTATRLGNLLLPLLAVGCAARALYGLP